MNSRWSSSGRTSRSRVLRGGRPAHEDGARNHGGVGNGAVFASKCESATCRLTQ
jgi:hypothetical protein